MQRTLLIFLVLLQALTNEAQTESPGKAKFDEAQEYNFGISKPYDPAKAFTLYNQAAEEGSGPAMNAIGNFYAGGTIVAVDIEKAMQWYQKAGAAGYVMGYNNLGNFYKDGIYVVQNFTIAANYYSKGAALSDPYSQRNLAYFYYKGLGVKQNYIAAFRLFKELAIAGDANAQYFVGLCYRNGYGTIIDIKLAKEWLQKASDLGELQATHELTKEPLPENRSVINNDLQKEVTQLKSYSEKFISASTNDISGIYSGVAVYYDFSGKFVHEIVPLKMKIDKNGDEYKGYWLEGDSLKAYIKASFKNNIFLFDSSSKYIRKNYYSYRAPEPYQFNTATLETKYMGNTMSLSGNVRFYSTERKEPGQPLYIMLNKKMDNISNLNFPNDFKLSINPNPVTSNANASFTISHPSIVTLQLLNTSGTVLSQLSQKKLPSGTYTYPFDVHTFSPGSYILKVSAGTESANKIFIKL